MIRTYALLAAALLPFAATAGTVTIDFSGTIYSVSASPGVLLVAINSGDHYTAQIQYDPATPAFPFGPEDLYNPANGSGYFSSFTANINGHVFQSDPNYYGQYAVTNSEYQFDELRPAVPAFVNIANTGSDILQLELNGGSHALSPLPTTLNLGDYSFKNFQIQYNTSPDTGFLSINGTVDQLSATFTETPEPPVLWLLGSGLLCGLLWRAARYLSDALILARYSAALARICCSFKVRILASRTTGLPLTMTSRTSLPFKA
jgi:hypothetical protein